MTDKPDYLTKTAQTNIFFQDFLCFLKLLEKRPLGLTQTGNLQIKGVDLLGKLFKHDMYCRDKKGKIMFKTTNEWNFRYLLWIRQIAKVMYLVYQRKGKLWLSKNGKGYLHNIDTAAQYEQMILWYFHRCNWGYLNPRSGYNKIIIAEVLQQNQKNIWSYFINSNRWLNFKLFAKGITDFYKLSILDIYGNEQLDSIFWVIENVLVDNLEQLGLIEAKREFNQYSIKQVLIFRPTKTGQYIFKKALEPF